LSRELRTAFGDEGCNERLQAAVKKAIGISGFKATFHPTKGDYGEDMGWADLTGYQKPSLLEKLPEQHVFAACVHFLLQTRHASS